MSAALRRRAAAPPLTITGKVANKGKKGKRKGGSGGYGGAHGGYGGGGASAMHAE